MIEILVLFVVGIGVGTFGTLIGIGGGLIMIPLFTFALTPSIFIVLLKSLVLHYLVYF